MLLNPVSGDFKEGICHLLSWVYWKLSYKKCQQTRSPTADEWIRKLWYIHTMEFESVLRKWMKKWKSLSGARLFATPRTAARQASCPSLTPRACSNSWPLSRWCHPTISSSVVHFSSCPQSSPASGSFQMNQFFPSGGQSIGVSTLAIVLSMNTQDWSPLRWTGWTPCSPRDSSRVFSNTTV